MEKEDDDDFDFKNGLILISVIVAFATPFIISSIVDKYTENKKASQDLKKEISDLKDKQNREIEDLKEKTIAAEKIARNAEKKNANSDTTSLVNQWQNHVVHIGCTNDEVNFSLGSGIMTGMKLDKYNGATIVTNAHVVVSDNYRYRSCFFKMLGDDDIYYLDPDTFEYSREEDVEWIPVRTTAYPNDKFRNIDNIKICSETAEIGDAIVVLGYPGNGGTRGNITATEGIISSYDGHYYVTSAKIDHGNSGGAAILKKNNCYLGIPTWAQSGGFESFGRILDYSFIFGK